MENVKLTRDARINWKVNSLFKLALRTIAERENLTLSQYLEKIAREDLERQGLKISVKAEVIAA